MFVIQLDLPNLRIVSACWFYHCGSFSLFSYFLCFFGCTMWLLILQLAIIFIPTKIWSEFLPKESRFVASNMRYISFQLEVIYHGRFQNLTTQATLDGLTLCKWNSASIFFIARIQILILVLRHISNYKFDNMWLFI